MPHRDDTGRKYGAFYYRTKNMDLTALADHMYSLLTQSAATEKVPAGTEFALWHNGTQNVVLKVLHLGDEFLLRRQMWTRRAQALHDSMERFFEAFNWTNEHDGLDRRFIYTVHLLSEAEQESGEHLPGLFFSPAAADS